MKRYNNYTFAEILVISLTILIFPIWFPVLYVREKWTTVLNSRRRQELRRMLEEAERKAEEWKILLAEIESEKIELAKIEKRKRRIQEMYEKRRIRRIYAKCPGYYRVTGRCDQWWCVAFGVIEAQSIADAMQKAPEAGNRI